MWFRRSSGVNVPGVRSMVARAALSCLLLVLCTGTLLAEGPDCSRYVHDGLALSMDNRQVWKTMGGRGTEEGRIGHGDQARTVERFDSERSSVLVYYDRAISKKSNARVVSIDIRFTETPGDFPPPMGSLLDRLGQPDTGGEFLALHLQRGTARWIDPVCEVRVEAFRRTPDWWEPTDETHYHVRIETLDSRAE
jgi:hypothetical protein